MAADDTWQPRPRQLIDSARFLHAACAVERDWLVAPVAGEHRSGCQRGAITRAAHRTGAANRHRSKPQVPCHLGSNGTCGPWNGTPALRSSRPSLHPKASPLYRNCSTQR